MKSSYTLTLLVIAVKEADQLPCSLPCHSLLFRFPMLQFVPPWFLQYSCNWERKHFLDAWCGAYVSENISDNFFLVLDF